jgi:hypothetical protein
MPVLIAILALLFMFGNEEAAEHVEHAVEAVVATESGHAGGAEAIVGALLPFGGSEPGHSTHGLLELTRALEECSAAHRARRHRM